MTDRPDAAWWRKIFGAFSLSVFLAFSPQVLAQDDEEAEEEAEEEVRDEVIVTGSRIKRDTYSSIAPLQIISGQISREVGLMDAGDILQESTAASGQQIDLTFNGFVLDNGPGQTNINLRGLGGARTLVLVNGRRVAPAGVEGAPVSPDLGLIPSSLVQQYDLLLDGASSVYGSDAVAGVANVIMRKDFDGLEIEAFSAMPDQRGGTQNTLSVTWGKNFDRGFIGFGAEHSDQDRVRVQDRKWIDRCNRHAEIDENGVIRSQEVFFPTARLMPWDDCKGSTDLFTIFAGPGFNETMLYTAGTTNAGVPNWSDWAEFAVIDLNNDGIADVNFRDYSLTDKENGFDLFAARNTTAVTTYGEYTFEGEANLTPFFEASWARRESRSLNGAAPLFPAIPALNPFNPCNPFQPNGVDCALAQNELFLNPGFEEEFGNAFNAGFGATYTDICAAFSISPCNPVTVFGPNTAVGAIGSPQHIVYVDGDRNNTDVELDQTRVVLGVTGDLPMVQWGSVEDWSFELAGIYSTSTGTSDRFGIRGDRLDLALGAFSSTGTPCENDLGAELSPTAAPGCVPVNLFAASLLDPIVNGQFETQAERDYLFDNRSFETEYEQTVLTAYFSGDLFGMPGGVAAGGFGFEYRKDELTSLPNEVAFDGLFFGFSRDEGAVGDKYVKEFFAEIEFPLLAGVQAAEELSLNLSARYTDDEIYGGEWTESAKVGWRPTNNVLVRATFGTSFRAPNLRELFLANQTGFNNSFFDPCYIPLSALDEDDMYDPTLDTRDPTVLANCLAQGVDPTIAGENRNGDNTYPIEIRSGGSLDLLAEESESWTAGLVWEAPTNAFDLSIGGTYYEINIENTIIEPTANFIVSDCYGSLTGNSPFCSRITRDFTDPSDPMIDIIDEGFINRDSEQARGVDINLTFADTLTIADRPVELIIDMRANRQLERSTLFVDEVNGVTDFNNFVGEFGFPTWKGRSLIRLEYADWRFNWETNYLGSMDQDLEGVDDFEDAFTGLSDTCFGPPDDVLCRDIGFANNYFRHGISLFYFGDNWNVGGGIRNLFNKAPPFVDSSEVQSINNAPIGYGYDLQGREFFINFAYAFTGSN